MIITIEVPDQDIGVEEARHELMGMFAWRLDELEDGAMYSRRDKTWHKLHSFVKSLTQATIRVTLGRLQ